VQYPSTAFEVLNTDKNLNKPDKLAWSRPFPQQTFPIVYTQLPKFLLISKNIYKNVSDE